MAALRYEQLEQMSLEMASLVRANIPLPDGLRRLAEAAGSGRVAGAYQRVAAALERGAPLSGAMSEADAPPEFVAAIRCAEISGNMADVLESAIEHCRRVDYFYGKFSNILLYPIIVLAIAAVVVTLLSMILAPRFENIFAQFDAELPAPTILMLSLSRLLRGPVGWLMLVAALFLLAWTCSPWFIRYMPALGRRLPFFRDLIVLSDLAMLARFLERMLRRGIPLPIVLEAAGLAVWSVPLRARLHRMARQAQQGRPVFDALGGAIPALPQHLLQQAEARGDLIDACPGIARYCEERFELQSESRLTRFEPALIVLIGCMVGLIIISLYAPLFSIPKLIK